MITELEAKRRAAQRQIEQLTAPQRAIEAAEQELSTLEAQIEAQRQQDAREAVIARLVDLARAGAMALRDVELAQQAFDAAIAPVLADYSTARERQAQARNAFYDALATIAPEARKRHADQAGPMAILNELEQAGADLGGVLANFSEAGDRPLDRASGAQHQFPGSLQTALREKFVHDGGHLPPNRQPQIEQRTAAQLLGSK